METEDYERINVNTIKEMILDEEKLVSYITLSRDLCMHVNNSKKLLNTAIETIREEQPNVHLNVSFIISGRSEENTASTKICIEKDLDKIKKSLTNVYFYHVYSVCKGSPGVDPAAYLLLNKYNDFNLCAGIIKGKECYKRSSDEIGNLKTNSEEKIIFENKPVICNKKLKQEDVLAPEPSSDSGVENTKPIKLTEIKPEPKIKTEVISPKKQSNINKQTIHKSKGIKAQKEIASFFNKPNGIQSKVKSSEIKHSKSVGEKMDANNENKVVANIKQDIINDKLKKEPIYKEEHRFDKKKNKPDEINTVLSKIKQSSKIDKKRKRVLQVSDSESDENNDPFVDNHAIENASDDEIPPTPSANVQVKITLGITNPKKRRKMVDKTYTDEDGYILTKKVEVYESCSENEEEVKMEKDIKVKTDGVKMEKDSKVKAEVSPKAKRNSPKKTKKKMSPIQKGKQSTLNSFFKKA